MRHEHQKLFDEAWKSGGASIGELFSLAQRYLNSRDYQLAAECFRNAAMAYKHENFRQRNETEALMHKDRLNAASERINEKWLNSNRGRLRQYPLKIEGLTTSDLDKLLRRAMHEPWLSDEIEFLEANVSDSLRRAMFDIFYPAFGFIGSRHLLDDPKLRPTIDTIVDYLISGECRNKPVKRFTSARRKVR